MAQAQTSTELCPRPLTAVLSLSITLSIASGVTLLLQKPTQTSTPSTQAAEFFFIASIFAATLTMFLVSLPLGFRDHHLGTANGAFIITLWLSGVEFFVGVVLWYADDNEPWRHALIGGNAFAFSVYMLWRLLVCMKDDVLCAKESEKRNGNKIN
jgi:hypothetical protein